MSWSIQLALSLRRGKIRSVIRAGIYDVSLYVWEELDLYGADSKRVHGDDDDDDWLNRDWEVRLLAGYSDIIMRDKLLTCIIHSRAFFSLRFPLDYGLCGREPARAKKKKHLGFATQLDLTWTKARRPHHVVIIPPFPTACLIPSNKTSNWKSNPGYLCAYNWIPSNAFFHLHVWRNQHDFLDVCQKHVHGRGDVKDKGRKTVPFQYHVNIHSHSPCHICLRPQIYLRLTKHASWVFGMVSPVPRAQWLRELLAMQCRIAERLVQSLLYPFFISVPINVVGTMAP